MITFTAKDIIRFAKFLSNTRNSQISDYYANTILLSTIYRDVYSDIINNDNQFVITFETDDEVLEMEGVFSIVYIEINGHEITRSSLRSRQTGGYYIENNTLYLPAGHKVIKYTPFPETITCPDDYEEISVTISLDDSVNYAWPLNGSTEPNWFFGEEINEVKDWMQKDGVSVVRFNVSHPYCFVSYSDGTIRLYTSKEEYSDWNPTPGKYFKGKVIAFTSNLDTGKGIVYYDTNRGKYYSGSFVPNTVLSFPDNTMYTLMSYKLAGLLASLVGLQNPKLDNLEAEATTKFYATLSKGSATRITNVMGHRNWW